MSTADTMKKMRATIVNCAANSKEGHVPSALSILDILWVLYDKVLDTSHIASGGTLSATAKKKDYFILSKGHASLGLYTVLAEKKLMDPTHLDNFCSFDSPLGGHPDRNKVPAIEASTGSLGHGVPMAVGIALGIKIAGGKGRVFVLAGDGECNEGTIWESALLAQHQQLGNLRMVIDYNHSTDRALGVGDLTKKFESFGWNAVSIDGHDQVAIESALTRPFPNPNAPVAIIAETVKGRGIKSMEHNPAWHHKSPNKEEIEILAKEIHEHH